MPAEMVPILKGKGDIWNCCCYGAVKLLEHGMKAVEKELLKRLCAIVTVDEIQFGSMPERQKLMQCLSYVGCKKSIMLKESSYVCDL